MVPDTSEETVMASVENVVIIGSGPAAWTAAIYAARASLNPLVFEGEPSREMIPGGQLMWTTDIENFPGFPDPIGGQELMDRMKAQALHHGARVITEDIAAVDFSARPFRLKPSYGEEIVSRAVIVASGARANWLGVPNEERLARTGGGVSACAVCDGALPAFRGAKLAVVGGGDTSMEESTYLTKYAEQVYIIHRRDSLRASRIMADRALSDPKITVLWNKAVEQVLGDDFVTGVQLRDTVTGELSELQVGGLFVAIGHTPNTAFLGDQLEMHASGYIKVAPGRTCTSVDGVFAAGDVMDDYYRQAVTAAGTGCMAALEAERWLAHQGVDEAVSPVLETAEAQPPASSMS
jgi:thioredoxin reductase (NADPH)